MKRFLFILLTAVMVMGSTVTAFAMDYPDYLPELPSMRDSKFAIFDVNGLTVLFIAEVSDPAHVDDLQLFRNTETNHTKNYSFGVDSPAGIKWYLYHLSNGNFKHIETREKDDTHYVYNYYDEIEFIYTSHDVVDQSTGKVVFPLPLAEQMIQQAEETLTVETMPELNRTVLVVVLCGVGCLALVTSLVLLRKVLPRFLG